MLCVCVCVFACECVCVLGSSTEARDYMTHDVHVPLCALSVPVNGYTKSLMVNVFSIIQRSSEL